MKITTVGIDLAKNVIQVHGVDERGKTVLKKSLKRMQVLPFFAHLPVCLIGMEACGSAHHWARKLQTLGPVSYTHLDVYKRQLLVMSTASIRHPAGRPVATSLSGKVRPSCQTAS